MAQSLRKSTLLRLCHYKSIFSTILISPVTLKTALRSTYHGGSSSVMKVGVLSAVDRQYLVILPQNFSTSTNAKNAYTEGDAGLILLEKLNVALAHHRLNDAWEAYNDFKKVYGFPNHSVTRELIIKMSYSCDTHWLQQACNLVFLIHKGKSNLLQPDYLSNLSLSLARAQMPSYACMILRLMIEREMLPSENLLELFFLHITRTDIGAYLASNILVEICDRLEYLNAKRSITKRMKLNTVIFNTVLNACVRFGSFFKGQQIVEVMSRNGIIADAHSIVIISQIHEANGQRDDLMKFKHHVERVPVLLIHHYRQFYDNLLSLHFKFNDVDAASQLILDVYRCLASLQSSKDWNDFKKPCLVPIGSHNLRKGLKLQVSPEMLQKDSMFMVETDDNFFAYKNGKIVLTRKGIAWVVVLYRRCGRITELSKLLVSIQKVGPPLEEEEEMISYYVVDAFINLGWLDIAHDLLDDLDSAGYRLDIHLYASLLRAYSDRNMTREADGMIKQLRTLNLAEAEDKIQFFVKNVTRNGELNLVESFIREMEENDGVSSTVYTMNSSIYFFWKAQMIDDALKAYRKMQEMKIHPTMQTYQIMVSGYSSLEMYREITILWGDIKGHMENGNLVVDRELYELLILNFLRGGYFERVMEVIGYMKKHDMYIDKWFLRTVFLKLHKSLYRNLQATDARTEAQHKRIENVRAFRKWVGLR